MGGHLAEFACEAKRVKQGKFMNCEWVKHGNPGMLFSFLHFLFYFIFKGKFMNCGWVKHGNAGMLFFFQFNVLNCLSI